MVAEHQKSATYEIGFKLTLQGRNCYNASSLLAGATVDHRGTAKKYIEGLIHINDTNWYVPHNTPNSSQQKVMLEQNVSRLVSELAYIIRKMHQLKIIGVSN